MKPLIRMPLPILILAFAISACGQNTADETVDEITLAVGGGPVSTLAYVARDNGFFADNGLDVEFIEFESGKAAAAALLAGEADLSTSADSVLVANVMDGNDLKVITTISQATEMFMVARRDHGISEISDLRGKKVGVTRGSTGEFFLGTFLTFNGLSLGDVEIVDLSPLGIVESATNGDIDAGFTWHQNIFKIEARLGETAVTWPGQSGRVLYFTTLAKDSFVSERPDTAAQFVSALKDAEGYAEDHADQVKAVMADTLGLEPAYADAIWPDYEFVVNLPQALIVTLEDQARWRIENALTELTETPNFLDNLYTAALDEVSPGAVTIIR